MELINKRVNHIKYGAGVITEVEEHVIRVQFKDPIGIKAFLYPEAFEDYLKAVSPNVENTVLEALHIKQEQIKTDLEQKEHEAELEAAKLEKKKERSEHARKKSTSKSTKKKA